MNERYHMPYIPQNPGGLDVRASVRLLEAQSADQLPSPSTVARKLLTLSTSSTASTRDIAQVVKADPALCGRLLKLANSPLVGFSRPIAVIDDAIILLGVQAVHKLAIGMSVLDKSRKGRCPEFGYDHYWRHCVLRAVAAQILAANSRMFNPGEAFSVALLADIGKLVLATLHPTLYARTLIAYALLDSANRVDQSELRALEREHFAIDHGDLSHALLMDWGLIEIHLLGLRMFYYPEEPVQEGRAADLARVIAGAEHTASHLGSGSPIARLAETLLPLFPQSAAMNLDLDKLLEQVRDSAAQWNSILGLPADTMRAPADTDDERAGVIGAGLPDNDADEFHEQVSNILIADDDSMMRSVLTAVLVQDGYQIVESTDGEHALAACLSDTPDIVILDWEMPNMTGIQVCRAIRKSRNGSLYYVIVLTAHSDEAHLVEAFGAGADDFIPKPVSPAELRARVAAASRLVQLRRQVEQERSSSCHHVAKLTAVARRMRDAALTDFLTGIPNRRSILDFLNTAWATSDRSGSELSCLFIDIDHFKHINDVLGHDAGDLVLQRTADVLREALRSGDNIGRLGGEEFLVVAPITNGDAALQLGERLRAAMENHDFGDLGMTDPITISIGVATRGPLTPTAYALVTRADTGLLSAKRHGRNQCRQV